MLSRSLRLKQVGLDALCEKIAIVLADSMDEVKVLLPFHKGDLVELFHRRGRVQREQHKVDGTFIRGRIPRVLRGYYAPYISAADL